MITVYQSPGCSGCRMTKMVLDQKEVTYDTVDLTHNEGALRAVKFLGYQKAPVVCVTYPDGSNDHWYGFRPDKIQEYIDKTKGAA
ncbi:ribonucleoside-diphosphate reductase class Ib glutaredoxin subunit [Brevibacterium sanguinis]|uniref:Ribonucleoside-diphosphate reductase class Ib glutaredoxin subunit n=2 Tax=Brevibacterium TaxID=1696 RepID=A0A366IKV1_9MICO|nr:MULTISPECIES: glutaredoxin family protein [Brevibacterium]RBP66390.1 ribonucleoside-diphosphate reductase class Ib glutaredoxin subunit [Brevibacterium sanguinis]RBP73042.1 ribonucleoside-diphosphate reductase class Ib glutaredoxin subunit [Brevibacterium celere]